MIIYKSYVDRHASTKPDSLTCLNTFFAFMTLTALRNMVTEKSVGAAHALNIPPYRIDYLLNIVSFVSVHESFTDKKTKEFLVFYVKIQKRFFLLETSGNHFL